MGFDEYLREIRSGWRGGRDNLVVLAEATSTNDIGKAIVREFVAERQAPPFTVVLALAQSAGRGRHGRPWASPAGQGVYASLVVPLGGARELQNLPLLAAVALARAIQEATGAECRLKWPNDLMIAGRKVGGLIVEGVSSGEEVLAAVLGFGVNWGPAEEPFPVADATSILAAGGDAPALCPLTWRLVAAVEEELPQLPRTEYARREYAAASLHKPGDTVRCHDGDGPVEGRFVGFEDDGSIRISVAGSERVLRVQDTVEFERP